MSRTQYVIFLNKNHIIIIGEISERYAQIPITA